MAVKARMSRQAQDETRITIHLSENNTTSSSGDAPSSAVENQLGEKV
jgi:hypothetical protein